MDDDIIGSFFDELKELDAVVAVAENEAVDSSVVDLQAATTTSAPVLVSKVISKPAEIVKRSAQDNVQAVYSYEIDPRVAASSEDYNRNVSQEPTSSHYSYTPSQYSAPPPPPPPIAQPTVPKQNKVFVRAAAGEVWVDDSLNDWPENDFRIFVGDLAKEVNTEHLAAHFQMYKSFAKAKVS